MVMAGLAAGGVTTISGVAHAGAFDEAVATQSAGRPTNRTSFLGASTQ